MDGPFYGKFRGIVEDSRDPLGLARLKASVPEALGEEPSAWAMPCMPFTSPESEGTLAIPPVGTNVWIEFEHGDPRQPIWSGCFWTTAPDVPNLTASPSLPAS